MTPERTALLFRVDAAANVTLGLAALALLAAPDLSGLPPAALLVVGVATLGNAIDLTRTGRDTDPAPRAMVRSVGIDVAFGVTLLILAVLGLPGQDAAARWALAVVGEVSLVVAALKLTGLRSIRRLTPA